MTALLATERVAKSYAGARVLKHVSIEVEPGCITALIGPNGAGKTTLFDIITGFVPSDEGRVVYKNRDITREPAHRRARSGIVKTFQIPHPFSSLTLLENLLVAAPSGVRERFPAALFPSAALAREESAHAERAREVLRFLDLHARESARAGTLSGGEKKLLELGRALMLDPALLMLDEPLAGVPAGIGARILDRLVQLRADGKTLVVVEHNLEAVMRIADRVYVLVDGELVAAGTPAEVQADERVAAAYLGA